MNATDAFREGDPARNLSAVDLEPHDELLREILRTSPTELIHRNPRRVPRAVDWRPLIVTSVVAVVVAGLAVVAITAAPTHRSKAPAAPASMPTSTPKAQETSSAADAYRAASDARALQAALYAQLDRYRDARKLPALTWSDSTSGATGGPIDTANKLVVLAASCDGGGTVSIQVSGRANKTLNCKELTAIGPIDVASEANGVDVDVKAASGSPSFLAKAIAVEAP